MTQTDDSHLLAAAMGGERRSLARFITRIESRRPEAGRALGAQRPRRSTGPGAPHVVGVTGPPGSGKSTFVDQLVTQARSQGLRVAVVAVDPSSPFSGGAILGDRIRMERHTSDDGVYIRSLSSRGHLGGLSSATAQIVDLFDVVGFDRVIVETVGVGQSELSVMEVADSVVILLTPESGDSVQAMKAGLLEIGDVFVVNKADRPGADRMVRDMRFSVELAQLPWEVPVVPAVARDGEGIEAVMDAVSQHLAWCAGEGRTLWDKRRADARIRLVLDLVAEASRRQARQQLADTGLDAELRAGIITPMDAVGRLQ